MDAKVAFAGDADGPFERVVHHLVTSGGLFPHGLAAHAVVGALPRHPVLVAVVRERPGAIAEVERLVTRSRDVGLDVALVGGGTEAREALGRALNAHPDASVHAWHVADDGDVRAVAGGGGSGLGDLLVPPFSAPDWPRFWALVDARVAEAQELARFSEAIQARKPRATWALVGTILAVYVIGLAWGAPEDIRALLEMGAMEGSLVREGQIYRLLSSTFLHGSAVHVAFNAYVLWAIGSIVERILGTARFLVLYAAAGLGGGLLSLLLMDGVGVGASGAVWGLMTAELALVWRPTGLIPEGLRARMRQGAIQTLLMNVLISFMPGIGWAAHFGGGLVGAGLTFSGVLTRGLPRWDAGAAVGGEEPVAWRIGAAAAVVALVSALAAAWIVGRPWGA